MLFAWNVWGCFDLWLLKSKILSGGYKHDIYISWSPRETPSDQNEWCEMSTNAPFNLEIKEKRNTRDFYPQGSTVSHCPWFIIWPIYYVSPHDKMQGECGTDGKVRWFRKSLRLMPVDCNCAPPSRVIILRMSKYKQQMLREQK